MAKYKVYKLHFTTPVHFGDARDDYSISQKTIQSDTMYAALTACLAKLGKEIPDNGDLGCTISSLFPFFQEKKDEKENKKCEPIYFLPKPLKQSLPKLAHVEDAKKVKKVAWFDIEYFQKAINGVQLFESDADISHNKGNFLTGKKTPKGFEKFIDAQVSERVTVSRTGTEDATPFYMDRVSFKGDSGLYFLAEGDTNLVNQALELLQDEGIGTDRNVGNGAFTYEIDTIEIDLPANCDYQMSLSVFIPENKQQLDEMLDSGSVAYDFVRRGGWITTPPFNTLRKNVVYAFLPASVFKATEGPIKGAIVNLGEDVPGLNHPIFRCGKSLFIPIKL